MVSFLPTRCLAAQLAMLACILVAIAAQAADVPKDSAASPRPTSVSPKQVPMTPSRTAPAQAANAVTCEQQLDAAVRDNAALQQQVADLQQRLAEATRLGGSAVTAYCESDTVSRNTAGARNDCGARGYKCEPVSGLCKTVCTVTTDCAPNFVCDTLAHRQCVRP